MVLKKITTVLVVALLLISLPLLTSVTRSAEFRHSKPGPQHAINAFGTNRQFRPTNFQLQARPNLPKALTLQAEPNEPVIQLALTVPANQAPAKPPGDSLFPIKGIPILMYHSIANLPGNNLGVPPEKFADQMRYLHDAGYTTISFSDFYSAYQGQAILPKKSIILTFDDGYPDNYLTAFPVLKQYNFTATFFVVTSSLDHGMLTWDQLKEMQAAGMSIESHTVNHYDLRTLPPNRQRQELGESKREIERVLGKPVSVFCYPAGKYNDTTLAILNELGYKIAVTTEPGNASQKDPLLRLKRVRINGSASLEVFKRQLP